MTNNLALRGEGVRDVYRALEGAFGLTPDDWPVEAFETAGEMEGYIWSHLTSAGGAQAGAGLPALAFLRLRAVIATPVPPTPASPLPALAGAAPRRFHHQLAAASGLALPPFETTRRGAALATLLFLGLPVGFVLNYLSPSLPWLMVAMASWPLMIAVLWTDSHRVPAALPTLGELARQAAPLNHRKLAELGLSHADLREVLTAILADASGTGLAPEAISRDTRLFATLH